MPAPFTITQELLRHSVWLAGVEEFEELDDGGTHGEPVHWLCPAPLIMTQALLRHSVWFAVTDDVLLLDELLEEGGTQGEFVHWL